MKKTFLLFVTSLVLTILIVACNSSGNDPKNVAKAFLKAVQAGDFTTAENLSTKDSKMALQFAQVTINLSTKMKDSTMNKLKSLSFDFGEPVINGDEATIPVKFEKKGKIELMLKKEDGAWKMALDLNSLMKMGVNHSDNNDNSSNDVERKNDSLFEARLDSIQSQ